MFLIRHDRPHVSFRNYNNYDKKNEIMNKIKTTFFKSND